MKFYKLKKIAIINQQQKRLNPFCLPWLNFSNGWTWKSEKLFCPLICLKLQFSNYLVVIWMCVLWFECVCYDLNLKFWRLFNFLMFCWFSCFEDIKVLIKKITKNHLLKETTFGFLFLSRILGLICFFPQIPLLLLANISPPRI